MSKLEFPLSLRWVNKDLPECSWTCLMLRLAASRVRATLANACRRWRRLAGSPERFEEKACALRDRRIYNQKINNKHLGESPVLLEVDQKQCRSLQVQSAVERPRLIEDCFPIGLNSLHSEGYRDVWGLQGDLRGFGCRYFSVPGNP